MGSWNRIVSAIGGRRVVFALGAGLLVASIVHPTYLASRDVPPGAILIQFLLIAGPAVVLLLGAIRLPRSDVHPEFYPTVATWTLAAPLAMAALVLLYDVQPGGGIQDPVRAIPPLHTVAAAAGFGLGLHDARARSRELELQGRNRELQRTRRELERTVDSLESSNERLEQFAYAVSHDLQEPLRTVSSHVHLATRAGEALSEDVRSELESASEGVQRMQSLIEGLLAYARVETEGEAFESVDIEDLLADVRSDLQHRIERQDADVIVEDLPTVRGDADQLRQVFQNLLDNAIEYSGDEPPRIEVFAERGSDDGEVTIAVRDRGIGIEPEYTDQVFEVFERLHAVDEHEGTGIGLALVERIVDRHGGDVWVESEPGEGSTFYVSLPAADDAEASQSVLNEGQAV